MAVGSFCFHPECCHSEVGPLTVTKTARGSDFQSDRFVRAVLLGALKTTQCKAPMPTSSFWWSYDMLPTTRYCNLVIWDVNSQGACSTTPQSQQTQDWGPVPALRATMEKAANRLQGFRLKTQTVAVSLQLEPCWAPSRLLINTWWVINARILWKEGAWMCANNVLKICQNKS